MLMKFILIGIFLVGHFDSIYCWVFNAVNYSDIMVKTHGIQFNSNAEKDDFEADLRDLRLSLIYPGTKWCGAGDVADGYDDLGPSRETDICCREHDHCPDTIAAGETKHNITNTAFYTRLSCDCDERFRQCLRSVNSSTSKQIGTLYFNAIGTVCFRNDYPVVGCKRRGGWLKRKCLEYSYDTSKEKIYQWFDVPAF